MTLKSTLSHTILTHIVKIINLSKTYNLPPGQRITPTNYNIGMCQIRNTRSCTDYYFYHTRVVCVETTTQYEVIVHEAQAGKRVLIPGKIEKCTCSTEL